MSYNYYGPGYQPPQAYYPQMAPPQYPPMRKSESRFWTFVILVVGVIFVAGIVAVLAMLPSSPASPSRAYQYGNSQVGPEAISLVHGGFGASYSCRSMTEAQTMFTSPPSWWDYSEVMQGCEDYVHQYYPGI